MNTLRQVRVSARIEAADAGFTHLRAAETAIEQAFSVTANLAAQMPLLRAQARLSTVVGHDAVDEVAITLNHLSAALGGIVRTHGHMAAVGKSIDYRARATGETDKPPQDTPKIPPGASLSLVVADEAG